ncbi:hypothetical protein CMUS01_08475 [Colletotrichum musicola]|uniref:Uncharacterized protein n=1 Tax=Colletotrichum musicola TaxID=2175873 RepID=A0A8H6NCW5_9PEZI|nr:hypothetical protein CMUS01_08475 [Colletotrichum musicola]
MAGMRRVEKVIVENVGEEPWGPRTGSIGLVTRTYTDMSRRQTTIPAGDTSSEAPTASVLSRNEEMNTTFHPEPCRVPLVALKTSPHHDLSSTPLHPHDVSIVLDH